VAASSLFELEGSTDTFIQRLATASNLSYRWHSGAATKDRTKLQIQAELQTTLEFIASCKTGSMVWTLLSAVRPAAEAAGMHAVLADAAFDLNRLLVWSIWLDLNECVCCWQSSICGN